MKFNIPTIRLSLTNLLPIFALLILFSACTKENTALSDQEMADTPELDALVLLADDENTENNEINQLIYLFGRAIQEAAQQPELLSYMVESMEADVNGFGASILTMSSNNHALSEVIDNSLMASIHKEKMEHLIEHLQMDGHSIMNVLANKLLCQGITYQPVIYRLTREEVSPRNQDVIIAIAEEVTDEDEVFT